jgi:PII-like signaling protein
MGYGLSSKHVNTSRFWELVEKLPIVIEMVDKTEIIEEFYNFIEPELLSMPKGCMVYMEPVKMKLLKKGNKGS